MIFLNCFCFLLIVLNKCKIRSLNKWLRDVIEIIGFFNLGDFLVCRNYVFGLVFVFKIEFVFYGLLSIIILLEIVIVYEIYSFKRLFLMFNCEFYCILEVN